MDSQLQRVFVASGEVEAQQIRAFLEAAGIATAERGETLRKTHGLTVDGLGAVDILVSEADAAQAREMLASAAAGAFRLEDDAGANDSNDSNDPNDPNDPNVT
jgi:predicted deacylase